MKKIAVFADIHSNYLVFKKAIEDAKLKGINEFVFLGDYVTDGFDANKILDIIQTLNSHVINGNREMSILDYNENKHEDWKIYDKYKSMLYGYNCLSKRNIDFISSLPIFKIINIKGKSICISHSSPYSVKGDVFADSYHIFDKLIQDYNCDLYLFGHEHKFYQTKYKNKWFINPGSIGLPTDGNTFSYVVLSLGDKIDCKKVEIEYEYNELEEYYKNSDYYNKANVWCKLILRLMKDKYNYPEEFMKLIKDEAMQKGINISQNIPNDLFNECFVKFEKIHYKE